MFRPQTSDVSLVGLRRLSFSTLRSYDISYYRSAVEVELDGLNTDVFPELQKMTKDIQRALKDEILLTPRVKLVKKGSLPVSEGKAVRVKDLRPGRG